VTESSDLSVVEALPLDLMTREAFVPDIDASIQL